MSPLGVFFAAVTMLQSVSANTWDDTWPGESVSFASCNRVFPKGGGPLTKQPLWRKMIDKKTEGFFWIGDAVYPLIHNNDSSLKEALDAQLNHPQYQELLNTVPHIDGTWDDHDRGANDEGHIEGSEHIQSMYLDFLQIPKASPRRTRDGVYSAHRITNPKNSSQAIGVILLDTRSHRDPFEIEKQLPTGGIHPLVSIVSRFLSTLLGLNDGGDVLGSTQWGWLSSLLNEPLDAFIVVSSIQVNTTVPLVESWGHFVTSQQRLLSLLNGSNTVQFISGDVHYAEMGFHEITTSGMTHTCSTQFPGFCEPALRHFTQHRPDVDAWFTGFNYLHLDIDWAESKLKFSVLDSNNKAQLSRVIALRTPTNLQPASELSDGRVLICVLFFCMIGVLLHYCCCRRSNKKKSE